MAAKPTGPSPFALYGESAGFSKRHAMRKTDNDALAEKQYPPFLINRMFSYHIDTIADANQVNQWYHLPHRLQYDYYFHSLRARRRPYMKWGKKKTDAVVDQLAQALQCSQKKAAEAARVLSPAQQQAVLATLEEGGAEAKRQPKKSVINQEETDHGTE